MNKALSAYQNNHLMIVLFLESDYKTSHRNTGNDRFPYSRSLSGTEEKACRGICEGINRPRGTAHELRGADKVLHGVHKEQT